MGAESHQYPPHSSRSVALHRFLSLWGAVKLVSTVCGPAFPACLCDWFPPTQTHTHTHTHTYSTVDQLLLVSFYCIFFLQISISMNWCGLWSQSSGYWCFCTAGKLPPLLKKIESHTPDEAPLDKSQHETHQASLSGRRRVIKQVQRKQFCCNLLYIRIFEAVSGHISAINVTMRHCGVSSIMQPVHLTFFPD